MRRWRLAGGRRSATAVVLGCGGLLIANVAAAELPPPPAYLAVPSIDTQASEAPGVQLPAAIMQVELTGERGAVSTGASMAPSGAGAADATPHPPVAAGPLSGQTADESPYSAGRGPSSRSGGLASAAPAPAEAAEPPPTPDPRAILSSARSLLARCAPAYPPQVCTAVSAFLPQLDAASVGVMAGRPLTPAATLPLTPSATASVPPRTTAPPTPYATAPMPSAAGPLAGPAGGSARLRRSWQPRPPPGALAASATPTATVSATDGACAECVFAIGDSVMVGAVPELMAAIPHLHVDAAVSRQVTPSIQVLEERKAAGQLGGVVIVHLGTNGTFSARQFDEMMQVLQGQRRVVFVNVRVPRVWEAPNDTVLAEGIKRYPSAVLVDWSAAGSRHPEWFWDDGIHLRPAGAAAYAALIAAAVSAP